MATFAADAKLPVVDGHLALPDLRIEYETADGRIEYRDVELVTEHYSRGQLAGKSAASVRYALRAARLARIEAIRAGLAAVEKLYLQGLMNTRDANEGLTAFLARRPPVWEHH